MKIFIPMKCYQYVTNKKVNSIHCLTGIFFSAKNRFTSPMVNVPKWKMLAAKLCRAMEFGVGAFG
jgi:hypothetical protein